MTQVKENELPSTRRLLKATAVAIVVAGLILVTTVQPGVNEDEIGAIVKYGIERTWVTGVSLQPATYSGRHVLPEFARDRKHGDAMYLWIMDADESASPKSVVCKSCGSQRAS